MNKPNGISDKVWEMAEEPAHECFDASVDLYETGFESASVKAIIARAISKAIEETYEECAQIVDPIQTDDRMTDHEKHAFDLRDVLSQAIRSRSKGEE